MITLEALEREIQLIKERNNRVELDKAWETSALRKVLLIVFTYLSIGLYMSTIGVNKPWLNAVIPSVGFLLSTLTLPFFKDCWLKKYKPLGSDGKMKICESCGMPLNNKTISKHDEKYCIYCQNQETGQLKTYEQVRQSSMNAAIRLMGKTKVEAEKIAHEMMPNLPRWKK